MATNYPIHVANLDQRPKSLAMSQFAPKGISLQSSCDFTQKTNEGTADSLEAGVFGKGCVNNHVGKFRIGSCHGQPLNKQVRCLGSPERT